MIVVDTQEAIRQEREALDLAKNKQADALCLSGGGIRSAAFGFGVIQAFAEAGLLKRFHYLSTVSGGGYIGGWLTRMIASVHEEEKAKYGPKAAVELGKIEQKLAKRKDGVEEPEVRALRRYTNYLAPSLGPLSPDLWAGIVLWIRNTLINWLVFIPLFVVGASLPILYTMLIAVLGKLGQAQLPLEWLMQSTLPTTTFRDAFAAALHWALAFAAPFMFGITLYRSIIELPSHSFPATMEPPPEAKDVGKPGKVLNHYIVYWAVGWCFLAPLAVVPFLNIASSAIDADVCALFRPPSAPAGGAAQVPTAVVSSVSGKVTVTVEPSCPAAPTSAAPAEQQSRNPLVIPLVVLAIFISGRLAYSAARRKVEKWDYSANGANRDKQLQPFESNKGAWAVACLVSAGLNGWGLYLGMGHGPVAIALAGPLWVVVADILHSTLYVALRKDALRGDLDREWTARLNGAKLSGVLVYTAGALLVLAAPGYVEKSAGSWVAIATGGAASGTLAALLGKSARTMLAARKPDGNAVLGTRVLINAAIVLFGASLVLIAGRGSAYLADRLISGVEWLISGFDGLIGVQPSPQVGQQAHDLLLLMAVSLIACASWLLPRYLGHRINLNNFSMHAVYRNRLVRAFLGTARSPERWRPDQYTRFDPRDDVRMASTFDNRSPQALFPVVNVALNRTSGRDTARAERKAMPFTITPLRCGFADPSKEKLGAGYYAPTKIYAGTEREIGPTDDENGISLGTAIALSGAAASPNMGYHSSPLTAFVMTLFNVRLGAWLPNPACPGADEKFLKTADADGVKPILDEILGRSDIDDRYVYLSDGGHFDNLALYEMLRRRCRYMVVVDAGQDATYAYADLRMLIQRASTDLDIKVSFTSVQQVGEKSLRASGAVADVIYPAIDDKLQNIIKPEEKGTILYLKPWLAADAPLELRAFQVLRPKFPHEPTGNQFFTESDFESYRELGRYIAKTALKGYAAGVQGKTEALAENDVEMERLFASLTR